MKLFTAIFLFTLFSTIVGSNICLVESGFTPKKRAFFMEVVEAARTQSGRAGKKLRDMYLKKTFGAIIPPFLATWEREEPLLYLDRFKQMYSQLENIQTTDEIGSDKSLLYVTCDDRKRAACTLINQEGVSILLLGRAFFEELDLLAWLTRDTQAYRDFKGRFSTEPFASPHYAHPTNPVFELQKALHSAPPVMKKWALEPSQGPMQLAPNNPVALAALPFTLKADPRSWDIDSAGPQTGHGRFVQGSSTGSKYNLEEWLHKSGTLTEEKGKKKIRPEASEPALRWEPGLDDARASAPELRRFGSQFSASSSTPMLGTQRQGKSNLLKKFAKVTGISKIWNKSKKSKRRLTAAHFM